MVERQVFVVTSGTGSKRLYRTEKLEAQQASHVDLRRHTFSRSKNVDDDLRTIVRSFERGKGEGKGEKQRQLSEGKNCSLREYAHATVCATSVRMPHRKGDVEPRARTWTVAADGGHEDACVRVRSGCEAPERKSWRNETTGQQFQH
jgi:hypothetical protein